MGNKQGGPKDGRASTNLSPTDAFLPATAANNGLGFGVGSDQTQSGSNLNSNSTERLSSKGVQSINPRHSREVGSTKILSMSILEPTPGLQSNASLAMQKVETTFSSIDEYKPKRPDRLSAIGGNLGKKEEVVGSDASDILMPSSSAPVNQFATAGPPLDRSKKPNGGNNLLSQMKKAEAGTTKTMGQSEGNLGRDSMMPQISSVNKALQKASARLNKKDVEKEKKVFEAEIMQNTAAPAVEKVETTSTVADKERIEMLKSPSGSVRQKHKSKHRTKHKTRNGEKRRHKSTNHNGTNVQSSRFESVDVNSQSESRDSKAFTTEHKSLFKTDESGKRQFSTRMSYGETETNIRGMQEMPTGLTAAEPQSIVEPKVASKVDDPADNSKDGVTDGTVSEAPSGEKKKNRLSARLGSALAMIGSALTGGKKHADGIVDGATGSQMPPQSESPAPAPGGISPMQLDDGGLRQPLPDFRLDEKKEVEEVAKPKNLTTRLSQAITRKLSFGSTSGNKADDDSESVASTDGKKRRLSERLSQSLKHGVDGVLQILSPTQHQPEPPGVKVNKERKDTALYEDVGDFLVDNRASRNPLIQQMIEDEDDNHSSLSSSITSEDVASGNIKKGKKKHKKKKRHASNQRNTLDVLELEEPNKSKRGRAGIPSILQSFQVEVNGIKDQIEEAAKLAEEESVSDFSYEDDDEILSPTVKQPKTSPKTSETGSVNKYEGMITPQHITTDKPVTPATSNVASKAAPTPSTPSKDSDKSTGSAKQTLKEIEAGRSDFKLPPKPENPYDKKKKVDEASKTKKPNSSGAAASTSSNRQIGKGKPKKLGGLDTADEGDDKRNTLFRIFEERNKKMTVNSRAKNDKNEDRSKAVSFQPEDGFLSKRKAQLQEAGADTDMSVLKPSQQALTKLDF